MTCNGLGRHYFWRSTYDVAICAKCHPPAAPDLVTGRIGESYPALETNHD